MKAPIIAALAATFMACSAHAQVIGVHLVSHHFPARAEQNNVNPGAYVKWANGVVLGGYRNTLSRPSFYLGYVFGHGPFELTVGAITGYQKRRVAMPCSRPGYDGCSESRGVSNGYLTPMISPSVRLPAIAGITPRLSYIPGFGGSASVVHLSVEFVL